MKAKPKFVPHPSKVAIDKWEECSEGLFDPSTLGTVSPRTYLTNRLRTAFNAGWDAAIKHVAATQPTTTTKGGIRA